MDGKRFITKLHLRNLLSFGPEAEEFELEPLNVLIGPNASGKSNVIEAISLLQAAPDDIQEPIRRGGGVREWLWKGGEKEPTAEIEATILPNTGPGLRYRLAFDSTNDRFSIADETIADSHRSSRAGSPRSYYSYRSGDPIASALTTSRVRVERKLSEEGWRIDPNQSVLRQLRDWLQFHEITQLATMFGRIRVFADWDAGRGRDLRGSSKTHAPSDFLSESASNLAIIINNLKNRPGLGERIDEELRRFYPRATKVAIKIEPGAVQLWLHEEGLRDPIPATRMSDGTLRYLCLLSILLHPDPPPLVCIEEPEIGLHPDIVVRLAHLMQEASERMQLIVTTHSDALVAALSSVPEAVAICERDENGSTTIRRLSREGLGEWLERYTLGDLWMKGELGGVL